MVYIQIKCAALLCMMLTWKLFCSIVVAEMKRWQIFLLALGIGATLCLADASNDDDDDGIVVEDEKIVSSVAIRSATTRPTKINWNWNLYQENPKPASEVLEAQMNYQSPFIQPGKFHFADHFDDPNVFEEKWTQSTAQKDDDSGAKYDGVWSLEAPDKQILQNDLGLVLKSKAKHAAIASRLVKPFVFADKPLIVQYEVQLQDGQECGGSYIKLLSSGIETTDLKTVDIYFQRGA